MAEWELTFKVNIHAMFYLTKAAVPHMKSGTIALHALVLVSRMTSFTVRRAIKRSTQRWRQAKML